MGNDLADNMRKMSLDNGKHLGASKDTNSNDDELQDDAEEESKPQMSKTTFAIKNKSNMEKSF